MALHLATIHWTNSEHGSFAKGEYSREHTWTFDGGMTIAASPAPAIVPAPWSNAASVDPEEAFVAAISSCHLLTFLWVASRAEMDVRSYHDRAVGRMTPNESGRLWVSRVELSPEITWADGGAPSAAREAELHHLTHEECYIANSVRTEIVVIPGARA